MIRREDENTAYKTKEGKEWAEVQKAREVKTDSGWTFLNYAKEYEQGMSDEDIKRLAISDDLKRDAFSRKYSEIANAHVEKHASAMLKDYNLEDTEEARKWVVENILK